MELENTDDIPFFYHFCSGINLRTIEGSHANNKDVLLSGFSHLVGNALRFKASYKSKNLCKWEFGLHVSGFLQFNGNEEFTWVCVDKNGVDSFHHYQCNDTIIKNNPSCNACFRHSQNFYKTCRLEAAL